MCGVSQISPPFVRNQLVFHLLNQSRKSFVASTAAEVLATGAFTTAAAKAAAVAKVTVDDVKAV